MIKKYKYDIAISVAEEDLAVAEAVAASFRDAGISYYLYTEHRADNLGKDILAITLETYVEDARYVLMITSAAFSHKYWSGIENRVAQLRGYRSDYILQLRIDDTQINGIPDSKVYLNWQDNPAEITIQIKKKLEQRMNTRIEWPKVIGLTGFMIIVFLLLLSVCRKSPDGVRRTNAKINKAVLKGVVRMAGQPVKGVTVFSHFDRTETDELGTYQLQLEKCTDCETGGEITLFSYHPEYGSSEQECIINKGTICDFSISRNPANIFVNGMVRNRDNGQPLGRMVVKVIADQFTTEAETDRSGLFKIAIDKSQTADINAVRLQVYDNGNRFVSCKDEPGFYQVNTFNTLDMKPVAEPREEKNESSFSSWRISGYTETDIEVEPGDVVFIEAKGVIYPGGAFGPTDPEGRAHIFGLSVASYNIVPEFNHAALLCGLAGENIWEPAGRRNEFTVKSKGILVFDVNDNNQVNNSGHFNVDVLVKKNAQ